MLKDWMNQSINEQDKNSLYSKIPGAISSAK